MVVAEFTGLTDLRREPGTFTVRRHPARDTWVTE